MCGIFGVVFRDKTRHVNAEWLKNLTSTMRHRGPDGDGIFIEKNVGLGHRRLSILDLNSGQQPMFNEDGNMVIVYNGEVYNFPELKIRLESLGHTFRTNCDTEVIIHAFEEWGERCVDELRGMFAFAIYDSVKKEAFLARDRVGIKPLYYYFDDQVFLFASEIKAILKSGLYNAEVNRSAIDFYIGLGYVPAPNTLFKGIKKVRSGHTMTLNSDARIKERRYWDMQFRNEAKKLSLSEYRYELKETLIDCVRSHLISDVPVGVFLSGGLDSSTVVAIMSSVLKVPVKTFSVGYEGSGDASELRYAKKVARYFNTDHHEYILNADPFFDSLDTFIQFTEEPIVESAAVALYQLSRLAKKEATVLLSGEGADELLAGYPIYAKMQRIERYHNFLKKTYLHNFLPENNLMIPEKIRKYLQWVKYPFNKRYRTVSCDVTHSMRDDLYTKSFNESIDSCYDDLFEEKYKELSDKSILQKMLYVDIKYWLPDDLLLKADKSTMAASIELRVPFLDHKLLEYSGNLPDEHKNNNNEGKFILKKIMEDLLPNEIVYRKKLGFPVPIAQWFANDLHGKVAEILLDKETSRRGYFNKGYIHKILKMHKTGRFDYSRRLLSLLIFELWHRKYIDTI